MRLKYIIGVDEVGRGAIFGPVYVAALVMPHGLKLKNVAPMRDSKKLNPKQREDWLSYIDCHSEIKYAVSSVSAAVVDRVNIKEAVNIAASRSVERLFGELNKNAVKIILDGGISLKNISKLKIGLKNIKTIVRADERFNCVKLASVVAKVKRDTYIKKISSRYPKYDLFSNKGYGTKRHAKAVRKHGPSIGHRLTFLIKFRNVH